jgi:DNA-binding transcriptional ArsR family regulator
MSMDNKTAVRSLSALAQESRLAIFRALVQAGPAGRTAGQLAQALGISPSALTFHMKELVYADLASSRQEGRFVIHSAKIQAMNTLLEFLTENCCGGNPCSPIPTVTCSTGQTEGHAP